MKKLLCVLLSALMIISTLITTSAAEISEAVSATPDEVETQPTEGYCDGFYYTVLEDGTAEITNYDGKKTDLIIPEEVNGIAVTKIEGLWDSPFYETNIRHIFIGENITYINTGNGNLNCLGELQAFSVDLNNEYYCSIDGVLYDKAVTDLIHFPLASQITELLVPDTVTTVSDRIEITKHLKNITLGKNVKNFSGYAFTMHGELIENIFVDEDNPNFYSKNGVLYSKITNDVVAYPQNNRTKTFEIPENSNWIRGYCLLRDCKYIENVIVPTDITTLVTGGLCYCPNLKNIYVNEDNPNFCDIDGILYSKDRKTLLYYPRGIKEPTYNIYKNTETIGSTSFWGNIYLTNITIPDNVYKIDVGAFFNCENLKEITLPKNIVELSGIGWSCSDPGGHGEYIKYDDITIKGYSGTVAETYAKENGFTFISLGNVENTLGDVNGDGVISILDATEIQKYLASLSKLNENQIILADFNKDGIISIIDATEIQKYIVGLV